MSYQVLARKWRPKVFKELIGQQHVVTVLLNALQRQQLHHAYLFTGTRGVGKTTIARIFAKSLNCQLGLTSEPCGQCDVCLDIDQGRFVDLIEIDAASRTKVDDTREILDNVQYAPSRGRFKVYLIDEVHMLSRSSFNALLKTLEEPPPHVKFILATTDPQKIPITVVSRCLQFHLRALSRVEISTKLKEILSNEGVDADESATTLLAKAANGSMRDCLSLTDQAIAWGQGQIKFSHVQTMLGSINQQWPYKILRCVFDGAGHELMVLSAEIAMQTPSYSKLIAEIMQLLHQLALWQVAQLKPDISPELEPWFYQFAQQLSPDDAQLYYQILLNGRKDLPYAIDEQAGFDMTLLRLLAFRPIHQSNIESAISPFSTGAKTNLADLQDVAASPSTIAQVENESDSALKSDYELTQSPDVRSIKTSDILDNEQRAIEQEAAQAFAKVEQQQPVALHGASADHVVEHVTVAKPEAKSAQPTNIQVSKIDSVIATRNMLRSKKKLLEQNAKKPETDKKPLADAGGKTLHLTERDKISTPAHELVQKAQSLKEAEQSQHNKQSVTTVPAMDQVLSEGLDDQAFDPKTIKKANQVDRWANMVDSMALGGRIRQLALHAEVDGSSSDSHLRLNLRQSFAHLNTELAYRQLVEHVCDYAQAQVQVEINIVPDVFESPYAIQQNIDVRRQQWAVDLILNDENVMQLKTRFDAEVEQDTIKAH